MEKGQDRGLARKKRRPRSNWNRGPLTLGQVVFLDRTEGQKCGPTAVHRTVGHHYCFYCSY